MNEFAGLSQEEAAAKVDDFLPRAEEAARIKDTQQERFVAIIDAIAGARRVRDATGPADYLDALVEFNTKLDAVTTACEQT